MAVGIQEPQTKPGETRPTAPAAPITAEPRYYRFSVAQYHAMMQAGILTSDDRVELLEGLLVTKRAINPPHRTTTHNVRVALERIVPPGWYVDQQQPVATADSMPEPDVAVIRGDSNDYADRHPGPGEVALVVEVADTSLTKDKTEKKRIYAAAGIPIYWLVNLTERRIEVYNDPTGPDAWPDYRIRTDFGAETVVPLVLEGREIARLNVGELLPRAVS